MRSEATLSFVRPAPSRRENQSVSNWGVTEGERRLSESRLPPPNSAAIRRFLSRRFARPSLWSDSDDRSVFWNAASPRSID